MNTEDRGVRGVDDVAATPEQEHALDSQALGARSNGNPNDCEDRTRGSGEALEFRAIGECIGSEAGGNQGVHADRDEPVAPRRMAIERDVRAAVWDKTGGECWYCHKTMHPVLDFTTDHVIPVSKGGTNDIDNLVPCCRTCNSVKGAKAVSEFKSRGDTEPQTIRFFRELIGMTQKELADRLGVTVPAVYNWERRTYEPRGSQIREMARIFGVSMDDISFEAINKEGRHPE